jgi:hypothetical protein
LRPVTFFFLSEFLRFSSSGVYIEKTLPRGGYQPVSFGGKNMKKGMGSKRVKKMQFRKGLSQKGHDRSKTRRDMRVGKVLFSEGGWGIHIIFRSKYRPLQFL